MRIKQLKTLQEYYDFIYERKREAFTKNEIESINKLYLIANSASDQYFLYIKIVNDSFLKSIEDKFEKYEDDWYIFLKKNSNKYELYLCDQFDSLILLLNMLNIG